MRYGGLADLVRLAMQLQGRADGLSLDDIAEAFGISRRTAERRRDALRDAFPQIEELAEPGGRKRWRFPPGTAGRMADPTLADLAALNRAAELARKSGDAETARQVDLLSDRLRARLTEPLRRRLDPDITALLEADGVALRPGPREQLSAALLADLRHAILAGVWIEADHRARATGLLSRNARLGPLALLLGEGRQYLVAQSGWADEVRLFALAGFERVALTEIPFERPTGFDLQAWLQQSFGIWREEVQEVVWRFSPAVAAEAARVLFHPAQQTQTEPDGSLILRFTAGGLREMCWHLFRWGGQVEILAPPALRAVMAQMLREAASPLTPSQEA